MNKKEIIKKTITYVKDHYPERLENLIQFIMDYEPGWKTIEGTHVLFGENGQILKGPKELKQWFSPENTVNRKNHVRGRLETIQRQRRTGEGNARPEFLNEREKKLREQLNSMRGQGIKPRRKPPARTPITKQLEKDYLKIVSEYGKLRKEKDNLDKIEMKASWYPSKAEAEAKKLGMTLEQVSSRIEQIKKQFSDYETKIKQVREDFNKENKDGKISLFNFPVYLCSDSKKAKQIQALSQMINEQCKNADPNALKLFSSLSVLAEKSGHSICKVVLSKVGNGRAGLNTIIMPALNAKNQAGDVDPGFGTCLHELSHHLDALAGYGKQSRRWPSDYYLEHCFNHKDKSMSAEVKKMFDDYNQNYTKEREEVIKQYEPALTKLNDDYRNRRIEFREYVESYDALLKERKKKLLEVQNNAKKNPISALQDIYDALSYGEARDVDGTVKWGHGTRYFANRQCRSAECFAEYMQLSLTAPHLIEVLERDKPQIVAACRSMVINILNDL